MKRRIEIMTPLFSHCNWRQSDQSSNELVTFAHSIEFQLVTRPLAANYAAVAHLKLVVELQYQSRLLITCVTYVVPWLAMASQSISNAILLWSRPSKAQNSWIIQSIKENKRAAFHLLSQNRQLFLWINGCSLKRIMTLHYHGYRPSISLAAPLLQQEEGRWPTRAGRRHFAHAPIDRLNSLIETTNRLHQITALIVC